MIAEFRKSIESILYQRVTSPLYGTLLCSWFICNWKIWYLTLFVDSKSLPGNKLNYIAANYCNHDNLFYYPLISCTIILTIIPFASNGAYWLDLKFKTWRVNQKIAIEGKEPLTVEKSILLRNEISEQEDKFDKLLKKKNEEIELLRKQISDLTKKPIDPKAKDQPIKVVAKGSSEQKYSDDEYQILLSNKEAYSTFGNIVKSIKVDSQFPAGTPEKIKEFLLINGIILESGSDLRDNKTYFMSDKGLGMYKLYFNSNFN